MSDLLAKARMDLVDNYYAELEELAGERLDGFITEEIYLYRKLQIIGAYLEDDIDGHEIAQARIRRYGN